MKTKFCLSFLLLCSIMTFAQTAKKPTIMVIPSDHWCTSRYFTKVMDNQGKKVTINDSDVLYTALASGNAPDVIQVESHLFGQWA